MPSHRIAILFVAVSIAAITASAQVPPQPKLRPDRSAGGGTEWVEDFLPYLAGKGPKQAPKLDPKMLENLKKMLKEDVEKNPEQDPKKQLDYLKKLMKDNPQFQNDDLFKQALENMEKDGALPKDGGLTKDNLKSAFDELKQSGQIGGSKLTDPKFGPPPIPPSDLPKPGGSAADNEFVKMAQKAFGNSTAGQSAVKDLIKSLEQSGGTNSKFGKFSDPANSKFGKFGDLKGPKMSEFKSTTSIDIKNSGLTPPKFSGTGTGGGSFNGGGGTGGLGSVGGVGGVGSIGTGGLSALVVIAAIAAAIFLAILFLRKWQLKRETRGEVVVSHVSTLDFSNIHTREQLVDAFDTVSLNECGEQAIAWNHRVIASQISVAHPKKAEPAGQVSNLYEKARYAPPDEDLVPSDYADARRGLSVIAGVSP